MMIHDDYLHRWYIIPRNRFFNIYYHVVRADDLGRSLHDHPWLNCSIMLEGGYLETMADHSKRQLREGDIAFRRSTALHRLELAPHHDVCRTLFITGPKIRKWGFMTEDGWVRWETYLEENGYA